MKFIAVLKQEGGCDYTIGCGIKTIEIQAENGIDATAKIREIIKTEYNNDEYKLSNITMYSVSTTYGINVDQWYSEFKAIENIVARDLNEAKELAELKRLKEKYESN